MAENKLVEIQIPSHLLENLQFHESKVALLTYIHRTHYFQRQKIEDNVAANRYKLLEKFGRERRKEIEYLTDKLPNATSLQLTKLFEYLESPIDRAWENLLQAMPDIRTFHIQERIEMVLTNKLLLHRSLEDFENMTVQIHRVIFSKQRMFSRDGEGLYWCFEDVI